MVLVIYFSARTWEGFGKAVEEGAVGGGRKWMSLLTLQESSENTECGAEVEETNRRTAGSPSPLGTNQFCNHLPAKHSKMFEREFLLKEETILKKSVFSKLSRGMKTCWEEAPPSPVPCLCHCFRIPSATSQYHVLLNTRSVRVQWAAEQPLPSGITVIKRENVQSFWNAHEEGERVQERGQRQEQITWLSSGSRPWDFRGWKSMYQTEFLSIPSSPSPCFLSISLYSTEEGNDNDNERVFGEAQQEQLC